MSWFGRRKADAWAAWRRNDENWPTLSLFPFVFISTVNFQQWNTVFIYSSPQICWTVEHPFCLFVCFSVDPLIHLKGHSLGNSDVKIFKGRWTTLRFANCSPQAKSSALPAFVYKVLQEHSHTYLLQIVCILSVVVFPLIIAEVSSVNRDQMSSKA